MSNDKEDLSSIIEALDTDGSKAKAKKRPSPQRQGRQGSARSHRGRQPQRPDYLRIPFVGRLKSVIILALAQFGVFTGYTLLVIQNWNKLMATVVAGGALPEKIFLLPVPHLSITLISASLFVFGLGVLFFVDSEDYDPDAEE